MALTPGARLGHYEIVSALGAGGMGAVYRATDTTLKRQVAIKVLPPSFTADSDRRARFQREAEILAALNHPHIAAIYGLEDSPSLGSGQAGVTALVMELVEGEDLSQRIARGAILLDEALPIAKQIAEALEAAHEQGLIHRDLKPANIKVRADGTVKVLDFGLAKALAPAAASEAASLLAHSPTITSPAQTRAGVILGTAAYMSPEQARGKAVDKRADIWAFGAVLFEMLSGTRAFAGDDVNDTIVAVASQEPDWRALPAATPAGVRRLVTRCLRKDARARLRDIGDARVQIEELLSGASEDGSTASGVAWPPVAASRRRILATASAALVVGLVVAAIATWTLMPTPLATRQPVRFTIVPPATQPLTVTLGSHPSLAISPDGTLVVYVSRGGQLMLRAIDQLDARPLGGITGAKSPFFSPDGRWVGFFTGAEFGSGGELKKVSIAGGPAVSLCRYNSPPMGASWGPDDTIVFATDDQGSGLLRVSAAGGEPTVLTTPDAADSERDHTYPSVLPGRAILFTFHDAIGFAVAVLDLTTGQRTILIRGGSQAAFVPSGLGSPQRAEREGGYLVYAVAGTVRAVRFDPVTRTVRGDPVPVLEQILTVSGGEAEFSVSPQGTLVYVPGSDGEAPRSLVWVNRRGQEAPIAAPPRAYRSVRLSPDGTRVALAIRDQDGDIWIWHLVRQTLTRLTHAAGWDFNPVWTPDGRRIIFSSGRDGSIHNVYWQAADNTGPVERLTTSYNPQFPVAISPEGTRLIVREFAPKTDDDLRVLRVAGPPDTPRATAAMPLVAGLRPTETLVQTTAAESFGDLSPDGHWLAYQSDDSDQFQISVRPFPNVNGGHWTISPGGGTQPRWAPSGKELFYLDATNALTAVPVHTTPTFGAGTPTRLFDGRYYTYPLERAYDVSPDGQRFLMITHTASGAQPPAPASIVVVLNWVEELTRLVPPK